MLFFLHGPQTCNGRTHSCILIGMYELYKKALSPPSPHSSSSVTTYFNGTTMTTPHGTGRAAAPDGG